MSQPYSSVTDRDQLAELCKDVWGGTGYLPATAHRYKDDPDCKFLVLEALATGTNGDGGGVGSLVAAGNLRTMDPPKATSAWIEAVRVPPDREGQGICTLLLRELCHRARSRGKISEILSSTIDANRPMKTVFGKPGIDMVPWSGSRKPDWGRLRELPGWAEQVEPDDENSEQLRSQEQPEAKTILEALELEDLVSDASRLGVLDPIETYDELRDVLKPSAVFGTIGHLPVLSELLPSLEDLRESLARGLVRKLRLCYPSAATAAGIPALLVWIVTVTATVILLAC